MYAGRLLMRGTRTKTKTSRTGVWKKKYRMCPRRSTGGSKRGPSPAPLRRGTAKPRPRRGATAVEEPKEKANASPRPDGPALGCWPSPYRRERLAAEAAARRLYTPPPTPPPHWPTTHPPRCPAAAACKPPAAGAATRTAPRWAHPPLPRLPLGRAAARPLPCPVPAPRFRGTCSPQSPGGGHGPAQQQGGTTAATVPPQGGRHGRRPVGGQAAGGRPPLVHESATRTRSSGGGRRTGVGKPAIGRNRPALVARGRNTARGGKRGAGEERQ